MKWYILVVMMGMFSDGSQDIFVYHQPELPSLQACQEYVYVESATIRQQMMMEFEGKQIEQVFCMREDKLDKFLKIIKEPKGIEA